MRCLLLAVRDHLRGTPLGGMGLLPTQCEIVDEEGRPPAAAGEWFVAVHEVGDWTGNDVEGLDEQYGIGTTISARLPKMPEDRRWRVLVGSADPADLASRNCLLSLVERVRVALHLDVGGDRILNLANSYIGSAANGFVEPLRIANMGRSQKQGADWWSSDEDEPFAGYSRTVTFRGARRTQNIENMT